jgi:hypothetical protein
MNPQNLPDLAQHIEVNVFRIFGIEVDTGIPYLDAAVVLAVLIIVLAFVGWMRTQAKSRRPTKKGPLSNSKGATRG